MSSTRELRRVVVASMALALASLLIPSVPTTDPWGWIVWGRQIAHLGLNTVAGPPSWKPLPVLITTPLSLLGAAAPDAWLVVARAGGLVALWLAFRVAARLGGRGAGMIAALVLALSSGWVRDLAHGYSEPLVVALLLGAINAHLSARRSLALVLAALATLARPEAWPLLAVYGLATRPKISLLVPALAVPPLLWVLPDWWGSGRLLHAETIADVNLVHAGAHPWLTLLHTSAALLPIAVWLAAVAGVLFALRRRDHVVAGLGVLVATWFAGEVAATALGYPATARFLLLPASLTCLLAGVGAASLARLVPPRAYPHALVALGLAFAVEPAATLPAVARASVARARLQDDLQRSIAFAGGAGALRVDAQAIIPTSLWWNADVLAWGLHVPLTRVGTVPDATVGTLAGVRAPAVLFAPLGGRTSADPLWRPAARVGRCGIAVRVLARAGVWRVLAITPARSGCPAPSKHRRQRPSHQGTGPSRTCRAWRGERNTGRRRCPRTECSSARMGAC